MKKGGYVYIMTNKTKTVLYVGVTNDLCRRVSEHKSHLNPNSFTAKYKCHYCIYYEEFTDITTAIAREKAIKQLSRNKKVTLIDQFNPEWKEMVTINGVIKPVVTWFEQVKRVMEQIKCEMNNS